MKTILLIKTDNIVNLVLLMVNVHIEIFGTLKLTIFAAVYGILK